MDAWVPHRATTTDGSALAAAIARAVAGCRAIRPVVLPVDVPPPADLPTLVSGPRTTLVLAGERQVLLPQPGGPGLCRLRAGDAIIVPPGAWTRARPIRPHRFLAIDCYPTVTRFVLGDGASQNSAFHSDGPLPPAARHCLQAVLAMPADAGLARLRPLYRCFLTEALQACRTESVPPPGLLDWQRAVAWMHDAGGDQLDRATIARAVGVHPNHLSRLCRRFAGASLSDWLTERRMERARQLLLHRDLPVARVAWLSGYGDETHFRKRFKACTGNTPGAWRRLHGRIGSG
ncbi:MAG: helix-turn-helix transcriptional regulator [Planctomycetota bacterium]